MPVLGNGKESAKDIEPLPGRREGPGGSGSSSNSGDCGTDRHRLGLVDDLDDPFTEADGSARPSRKRTNSISDLVYVDSRDGDDDGFTSDEAPPPPPPPVGSSRRQQGTPGSGPTPVGSPKRVLFYSGEGEKPSQSPSSPHKKTSGGKKK